VLGGSTLHPYIILFINMPKPRKWSDEQLIEAVKLSTSYRNVCRILDLSESGNTHSVIKNCILELNLSIEHFIKYKMPDTKPHELEDILNNKIYHYSHGLRLKLIKQKVFEEKCYSCNLTEWLGNKIPLELEHIDGNRRNNLLENLTLLCPNCHALTPTYRGRNKGNKLIKPHG
jgi:hypothetical protein